LVNTKSTVPEESNIKHTYSKKDVILLGTKAKVTIESPVIEQKVPQTINNNRDLIYQYVKDYPGSHLRKISKHLSLGLGNIQYHLEALEKTGMIKSRKISIYKVYYDVGVLGGRHESILAILQQETPRSILLYLIENPGATQTEIATFVGCSAPTVVWHMSNLTKNGLVKHRRDGKFMKYHIKGNLKEITSLIKSYHPTMWDRLSGRLADLFLDIHTMGSDEEEDRDKEDTDDKSDDI
jgi:predicted transcriptional regulator